MTLNLLKQFAVDIEKENEGVWLDVGDGVSLKIAAAGNQRYLDFIRKEAKPYRAAVKTVPETVWEDITQRAYAATILVDWKGVADEDGSSTAYTPELGLPIFKDRANHKLAELILATANNQAEYSASAEAETAKN